MKKSLKFGLFFNGTWNTADGRKPFSNVKKMKDLVVERYTEDGETTVTETFYSDGPGTAIDNELPGGAFAADLEEIVCDAYRWLSLKSCAECVSGEEPEIYLFGFSRGAYLAHIFSWLLNDAGILTDRFSLIPELVSRFMKKDKIGFQNLIAQIPQEIRRTPVIRFVGLWDTVSAPLDVFRNFHDGEVAPVVRRVCHAMALDEKRLMFPVTKYRFDDARAEQRWFSGVHSDVGGGFADDTLSNIALEWMADMAVESDLILRATPVREPDFIGMEKHAQPDYLKNYRVCEGEPVDESVYRRMDADPDYRPCALNFPDKTV